MIANRSLAGWLREPAEGAALPRDVRHRLERALGADLRALRVHTGPTADAAVRAEGADALACGRDVLFARGAYRPDTRAGLFLLAHEAAHAVQQARSRATGRWTVIPAWDASEGDADDAAARAVAGVPAPGHTPRVTVGERASRTIQRHVSFEHRALGDVPTDYLVQVSTRGPLRSWILQNQVALMAQWRYDPASVTEQRVASLCPWIRTVRLGPDRVLATYGELNALPDYLANAPALDALGADILLPILQVIRQEGYNQLTLIASGVNPNVTFADAACAPWKLSLVNNIVETGALDALTMRLGVDGSNHYQGLLARNACHFAPYSWYRWQASHLVARQLATAAHASGDPNERARLTHEAWVFHGYADHFLQDSFAAGHLINKTLIMQWFVEWAAGQSLLPVADWQAIKNMTKPLQPNLAPDNLYDPSFQGPSNDPQTSEELATMTQRMNATGVVAGAEGNQAAAYQDYLVFIASAAAQLSSATMHDYYNDNSAWVASAARSTPYEVWGDDTLLTGANGGNGVQETSGTAQMSQQALLEILSSGQTSITTQSIRDHFPTRAGTSSSNVTDLRSWNYGQQAFAQQQFGAFVPLLKTLLLRLASPRLGIVSQDEDFTTVWDASLPQSGYHVTDSLMYGGRLFAGTNGYAYELDHGNGRVLHSLLVTGSVGAGNYETRLASDGQRLYVGVHGYVYAINLNDWSRTAWSVGVGGSGYEPASVLVWNGRLFAGSNAYVYELNPATGGVLRKLLLSSFGVGDYDTRLATDGQTLFAGTHGYVYGVRLSDWSGAAWSASLPNAGYTTVNVSATGGRLFAGSNGYVFQLDPGRGSVLQKLLVTGSVGIGNYETRVAADAQRLYVGVHGYVYGVSLGDWSRSAWNVGVGGPGQFQPVTVRAQNGRLFAGSNGYMYEVSPSNGSLPHQLTLSSIGVGDYDTRIASDGQNLYVGAHGYSYKILSLPNRNVLGVNTTIAAPQNDVFNYNGSGWDACPGYLTQIAAGDSAVVVGVNAQQPNGQNNVSRWNGAGWDGIAGYMTSIGAAADGTIWACNAHQAYPANNVYRWNGASWTSVAGYLTAIDVGDASTIWGVNAQQPNGQNNVYRWNGSGWDARPGHMTAIAVGNDGTVWAVNAQQTSGNNVYRWNGGGWDAVAGYLTSIGVGNTYTVWGCNATQPTSQNNVYQWNGAGWNGVAGYLTSIAAGVPG